MGPGSVFARWVGGCSWCRWSGQLWLTRPALLIVRLGLFSGFILILFKAFWGAVWANSPQLRQTHNLCAISLTSWTWRSGERCRGALHADDETVLKSYSFDHNYWGAIGGKTALGLSARFSVEFLFKSIRYINLFKTVLSFMWTIFFLSYGCFSGNMILKSAVKRNG